MRPPCQPGCLSSPLAGAPTSVPSYPHIPSCVVALAWKKVIAPEAVLSRSQKFPGRTNGFSHCCVGNLDVALRIVHLC